MLAALDLVRLDQRLNCKRSRPLSHLLRGEQICLGLCSRGLLKSFQLRDFVILLITALRIDVSCIDFDWRFSNVEILHLKFTSLIFFKTLSRSCRCSRLLKAFNVVDFICVDRGTH